MSINPQPPVGEVILRTQRNELFSLVREAGLDPQSFDWRNRRTGRGLEVAELGYGSFGYHFAIAPEGEGLFGIDYSPGDETFLEERDVDGWAAVVQHFRWWLNNLHREVSVPDLWTTFIEAASPSADGADANDQLSGAEVSAIEVQVIEAKAYLRLVGIQSPRLELADERLDYLVEKARVMGKFDWRTFAVGLVFNLAFSVAFNPEQAQHLAQLILTPLVRLTGS